VRTVGARSTRGCAGGALSGVAHACRRASGTLAAGAFPARRASDRDTRSWSTNGSPMRRRSRRFSAASGKQPTGLDLDAAGREARVGAPWATEVRLGFPWTLGWWKPASEKQSDAGDIFRSRSRDNPSPRRPMDAAVTQNPTPTPGREVALSIPLRARPRQGRKKGLSAAYHRSATICDPATLRWTPSEKSDGSSPV
jgi:hypothetical protein